MSSRPWVVRLSDAARGDYRGIFRWTAERFGSSQAISHLESLAGALTKLEAGPAVPGVRDRPDIGENLLALHMGRRGRHVILFRVADDAPNTIEVIRILHDAMDIVRHL